jgi:THAP domain
MPGCSAPNCSTHSRKGGRFFKFPVSPRRRAKWLQNCRRDKSEPGRYGTLCEVSTYFLVTYHVEGVNITNNWVLNHCSMSKCLPNQCLVAGSFRRFNQFETADADENGKRKLRRTAIPTNFDVLTHQNVCKETGQLVGRL